MIKSNAPLQFSQTDDDVSAGVEVTQYTFNMVLCQIVSTGIV